MNTRDPSIPRHSIAFLQAVIVLVGIVTVVALLWEPRTEGVNAHAKSVDIYFTDPFLALVYAGSIPFFIALYQAFKALTYTRQDNAFSEPAIRALRTIRYCALAIIGFVAAEEMFISANSSDDRAGGVFMGMLITFGSVVVAAAAVTFERVLQNGVDFRRRERQSPHNA